MASLAGKVITLTGGASGIGLATAKILASRGAFLAIADLRQAELKTAVEEIKESARGKVTAEVVDVRDRAAVRAFLESTLKEFGQIDGCANIAGVLGESMGVRKIWELESSEYDFVMDVNARGLFNCLAEELRPGLLKEGASIVNAASIMSKRAPGAASPYVASKHAVEGLTKAAAVDAGERGIRVNCFAPGNTDTPMLRAGLRRIFGDTNWPKPKTPISRFGEPEESGKMCAFLLSDDASFTTGATFLLDGGANAGL